MITRHLTSPDKVQMRQIVQRILDQQGLLAQFYWPADLLGAELSTAEAFGGFEDDQLRSFVLYRDLIQAWEISLVACDPFYARQGFTGKTLQGLIDAKSHNKALWLEVHEENVAAQKLYEKLGFKEVRRRPRYYADGATAILYTHPRGDFVC